MKTIHDENKIEEIIKSLKHKTLGTEESRIYSAMKEYAEYIREKTIDECIEIVRYENYILEDWYSSTERPREITHFNANQKNIATRNCIITNLNNLKNNEQ